jgi:hypothetical protein
MNGLRCSICGMGIKSSIYDFNNYSFIEKNQKGEIII